MKQPTRVGFTSRCIRRLRRQPTASDITEDVAPGPGFDRPRNAAIDDIEQLPP